MACCSPVILRVTRGVTGKHDLAMDAYTHVLGALRENDFARLRAYEARVGGSFETWLAVVTRRLTLDHLRARYGRARDDSTEGREAHEARRRLCDLVRLLHRVRDDRSLVLLTVPGALAPQEARDLVQPADRLSRARGGRRLSGGRLRL